MKGHERTCDDVISQVTRQVASVDPQSYDRRGTRQVASVDPQSYDRRGIFGVFASVTSIHYFLLPKSLIMMYLETP